MNRFVALAVSVVFSCVAFAAQKAPEKVDLTGTWTSEKCESMPNGQGGETYFTRTFPMTNKEWKIDFTVFGDKDCTQALFTLDVAGDWELRGKSKAVKGAHNAFFGFKTRTLTAKADGAVQFMNQAGFCGKKDWKVGEAVDINSTGCAQIGAKPITDCKGEHDLVKVDEGKVFLGDRGGDMCKKRNYPKKLYPVALIKKP
ncbi:MAG: hypothetical protein FJY29_06870 [Betaproteobacteria bacterium]|nr:hypothetical protein [Betaproteobacteria bacterium]